MQRTRYVYVSAALKVTLDSRCCFNPTTFFCQTLKGNIEGLRRVCAELQEAATTESPEPSCHSTSILPPQQQEAREENVYENIGEAL